MKIIAKQFESNGKWTGRTRVLKSISEDVGGVVLSVELTAEDAEDWPNVHHLLREVVFPRMVKDEVKETAKNSRLCPQCGHERDLKKSPAGQYVDELTPCTRCGYGDAPKVNEPSSYESASIEALRERIETIDALRTRIESHRKFERPFVMELIDDLFRLVVSRRDMASLATGPTPNTATGVAAMIEEEKAKEFSEGYTLGRRHGKAERHKESVRDLLDKLPLDPDHAFMRDVVKEVNEVARVKFPGSNCNIPALVEEVSEVAKAVMYEPWDNVRKECVQVAGMALRLAIEGDYTMREHRNNYVHTGSYWPERGDNPFTRYMRPEHMMPGHGFISCHRCGILLPNGYPPNGQGGCDDCKDDRTTERPSPQVQDDNKTHTIKEFVDDFLSKGYAYDERCFYCREHVSHTKTMHDNSVSF